MGLFFPLQGVKNIVNSSLLIVICGSTDISNVALKLSTDN